jgi:hypothetical protein
VKYIHQCQVDIKLVDVWLFVPGTCAQLMREPIAEGVGGVYISFSIL